MGLTTCNKGSCLKTKNHCYSGALRLQRHFKVLQIQL